ncbi:TPR-like protein [Viridothelium virens]|uniref:TPR-like protein n=1 Tax=Viridothelium virens TaxID=1048519 RepID=A0A6A6H3Q7_VIRVR|nr:TPR-like protein [Viridothelium virens]
MASCLSNHALPLPLQIAREVNIHLDACLGNDRAFLKDSPHLLGKWSLRAAAIQFSNFYASRNQLEKAKSLRLQVLAFEEQEFGFSNSDTLDSVHEMAMLYIRTDLPRLAEVYLRRTMKGYEALPGIDDVKLCKAMFNLAFTNEMRDGEFAETSYRQALEFSLSRLSQTHPLMTTISMGLGRTLLHEGRVGESIKIFENVISTCGQHEELYDMKMGAFLQLAVALSNRGQMMEAEDLLRRCSGEITDKLGPEHMLCIEYDLRLGCILITRGNFTEAEILLAKTLREDHANSLQLPQLQLHLGRIYEKSERYEQSIEILQQALEYGQTTGMFIIQNIVFTLGHSLLHEKRYNEAEKCITKFRNADSQKSSRLENAEKMYAEFLEKAQTVYVENHPEVLDCLLGLGMVSQGQERIEKASSFYSRAMEGSQAWYGPDHAYTRRVLSYYLEISRYQEVLGRAEA